MKKIRTEKYEKIAQLKKEFIIMRGLPGSGKSTLGKQLAGKNGQQFSSDDFFMIENEYNWDGSKINEAHNWNYERVKDALNNNISPVVLDNTNVSKKDLMKLKPLIEYAEKRGYQVRIEEPQTPWAFNVDKLYENNTHGVPRETIQLMLNKWYSNPSIEDIKNEFENN